MRFQRSLRGRRPFPKGYNAPTTEDINTDQPIFQIGEFEPFFEDATLADLPLKLRVRASVKALERQGDTALAIAFHFHQSLLPYEIYKREKEIEKLSQHQAVQLIFESLLTDSQKEQHALKNVQVFPQKGDILFEMSFMVQPSGKYQVPSDSRAQTLWGYGGYYRPGCRLEDIEQMFFTPFSEGSKTSIHMTRASAWVAKGITPKTARQRGVEFMNNAKEENMRNLVGIIEQGGALLKVLLGTGEKGESLYELYRSFAVYQSDKSVGCVEICFQKQEK